MIVEALTANGHSPVFALVAAFLALYYIWQRWQESQAKRFHTFPVADLSGKNVNDSIMRAVEQHPDEPFVLPMEQTWLMLPHKLINEVKKIPDEESSFMATIYQRMQGFYTGIGRFEHPEGIAAIRHDLTHNISKVLSDLQDECVFAFDKEVGDCSSPKEVGVYQTTMMIVSRLSARTFVGMPLCRDDEWIEATANLTKNILATINTITSLPPLIRPFVVPFLPGFRNLISLNFFFGRKIQPLVTAIVKAYKENKQGNNGWVKPNSDEINHEGITDNNHNLVHWTIWNFKNPERVTSGEIGRIEIGVAFAAIHTTSMTLSHIVFDLASHPEYVKELREELEGVLADEGNAGQRLRKSSIPKLKKLDSFMKESQRMNPIGMVNLPRIVLKKGGLRLSTGHTLPYGSFFGFAAPFFTTSTLKANTIVTDEDQPPLNEFYPWRFSDIRRQPGHETRHQFVSADDNDIAFGSGRHACPGRFFANNELKVILVELLMNYDISLGPKGQGAGQGGYARPVLEEHDTFCAPDPNAKIWIRTRQK